jgi:glycosyltransferase involved in cell wall biosynthesis
MDVSVVIPTYNRRFALKQAVCSVLAQTFPVAELVVVDDASDFDVAAYLDNEIGYQPNLVVIRNESNRGGAMSRNIGVGHAQSSYIALLDSDDYWLPEKLDKQMAVFKQHGDASVVCCDVYRKHPDGRLLNGNRQLYDSDIWERLLSGWIKFPNTSSLVFKKAEFLRVGGFDPALTSCQDHDLWMRMGKCGLTLRYVSEPLYVITSTETNRISSNYMARVRGINYFLDKWKEDLIAYGGKRHFRSYRNQYLTLAMFDIFSARLRHRNLRAAWDIYYSCFMRNSQFYREVFSRMYRKVGVRAAN